MVYTGEMKRWVMPIFFGMLLVPSMVFAQELTDLGVVPFGSVIIDFYSTSLRVVGLAVFVMFLIAGLSFILPEWLKPGFMSQPWTIIQDAVIGTVLLFSAYVILNTINPALTRFEAGTAVRSSTGSSAPTPTPAQLCSAELQNAYRQFGPLCNAGGADADTACSIVEETQALAASQNCTLDTSAVLTPTPDAATCESLDNIYRGQRVVCFYGMASACSEADTAGRALTEAGCGTPTFDPSSSDYAPCAFYSETLSTYEARCLIIGDTQACSATQAIEAYGQQNNCTP